MKIQSQNFYFKNTPASPPPALAIEWWPPYDQSQNVQLSYYSCSQRHYVAYIVDEFASKKAKGLAFLDANSFTLDLLINSKSYKNLARLSDSQMLDPPCLL